MSRTPSLLNPTIVQAGAGTGKTQNLANRIIDIAQEIYSQKNDIPRFVATTFTERATSELRERVVSLLSLKEDAELWLRDFVQDPEKLHISTIHGTLSLVLHRYGSLIGLDPEFKIIKTVEEKNLLGGVIRKLISSNDKFGTCLEHYPFGELIVIVRRLISHYKLHGSGFNVATGWVELLELEAKELLAQFSELCDFDAKTLSPKTGETVLTLQQMKPVLESYLHDFTNFRASFLEVVGALRKPSLQAGKKGSEIKPHIDEIFEAKKRLEEERYETEINSRHDEIAEILKILAMEASERFSLLKRERGLMTFDDLEFVTLELLEARPEVSNFIKEDWDFWFVDEFQDTSPLQKKLLFHFFRTPWNAYFVGDPQQSIYLFRGADANVFQDTKKLIEENNGNVERLKKNYRSHPDLLRFFNTIFKSLKPPMEILEARGDELGEVRGFIHLSDKEVDENQIVIDQVFQWRNEGISFEDIAVLVRTNDQARVVGRELSKLGVPVYVHSSGGFYDRREVLDALALLTFIEDPSDDESFILLCRSPWMGIPDQDLAAWGQSRKKQTYWSWLKANPTEIERFFSLVNLSKGVEGSVDLPLSQIFSGLLEILGFWEFCLVGDGSGRREANLRKLLWKLKKEEGTLNFSAARFIDEAWDEILDHGEETEAASFIEPARVNIMTVHKSKGLKFNNVIVPFCGQSPRVKHDILELDPSGAWAVRVLSFSAEEKISPLIQQKLKEERAKRESFEFIRVFYVAITRAAERVALIGSPTGTNSWFSQFNIPLNEGLNDNTYFVKQWHENPTLKKVETLEDESHLPPIHLKKIEKSKASSLTVTQVVQNQKGDFQIPFQDQLEAQLRGQAVHFIFEQLKWSDFSDLEKLTEAALNRFGVSTKLNISGLAKTLEIQEPPLAKLIKGGETEWPFVIKNKGSILKGQIDLWGQIDDVTWIIDYKSAKKFTEESLNRAKEQLELYALAVNKNGIPWERIKIAVIAPLIGEAMELKLSSKAEVDSRLAPKESYTLEDQI